MKPWLVLLAFVVACAPAALPLERFVERRPDPVADQGAHRSPVEWWYYNGHLETASGRSLGFAGAIFQVFVPETGYAAGFRVFGAGPFYFGHFGIVDKQTGEYASSERAMFPTAKPPVRVQQASASSQAMDVRLGDWRYTREPSGVYTFVSDLDGGKSRLELRLQPQRDEVIHGPGWSGTPQTGRMYYYSNTRLKATGTLDGEAVTGMAWFDHQWGGGDGDGSASIVPRWDWWALQLEDGRDIMVYRVRNAKNEVVDSFASIAKPGQAAQEVRDFEVLAWRHWQSPTGNRYPVAWHMRLPDGTVLNIGVVADNQEVDASATTGFRYYEGAVRVTGSVRGVGYVELAGYGPQRSRVENPFR